MKRAVFWVVAPCNLIEVTNVSEVFAALTIEAVRTSETLVNFYQTTRCYNPEDSHLRLCHVAKNSHCHFSSNYTVDHV
jgi:hypothetical protein